MYINTSQGLVCVNVGGLGTVLDSQEIQRDSEAVTLVYFHEETRNLNIHVHVAAQCFVDCVFLCKQQIELTLGIDVDGFAVILTHRRCFCD